MSFTATGHNPALSIHNVGDTGSANVTAGNAFALTTHNIGDLVVVINTDHTTTSLPNGISDSLNLCTWTKASTDFTNEANTNLNLDGAPATWNGNVWFGRVIAVGGPSTVTFSYSAGGVPAFTNAVGMEFIVTAGSWTLDTVGVFNVNTGQSSWPFPSAAGSGELAIGFAWNSSSALSGTTSGWVYNQNSDLTNNGMAYNLSVGPGAVTGPTWAESTECWGLMVLIAEGSPSLVSSPPPVQTAPVTLRRLRQQPVLPVPPSSVTIPGTLAMNGASAFTDATRAFGPIATGIAPVTFTGASAYSSAAAQLSPLSLAGTTSLSGVTVQGSGTAFGGQATLAPTAVQGSSVNMAGSASWAANAVQIAGLALSSATSVVLNAGAAVAGTITLAASSAFSAVANQLSNLGLTGSSTFTSSATQGSNVTLNGSSSFSASAVQLATTAFNAASTFTGNVVQLAKLAVNAASSIVLNAGNAVFGTISMAASAAWQSSAVQNSVVAFTGINSLSGKAVQGVTTAFNSAASLTGNVVQRAQTSLSASASWTGRLVTGILFGRSKIGGKQFGSTSGGREFGASAGSSGIPDSSISGDEV